MIKNKKILIIAAHPDDEILGCGGTIIKLKNNNKIEAIFMTNGTDSRGKNLIEKKERNKGCLDLFKTLNLEKPKIFNFPDNQMDTIPLLKIIKTIEKVISTKRPEIIFTHHENCLNIDHQITFQAVITACRPINNSSVKHILSFEIPSSSEWSLSKKKSFYPNYFIDITDQIDKKIFLMKKFYGKELRKLPHSRSQKSIKSLSEYRGSMAGVRNAEAFYLNRSVID